MAIPANINFLVVSVPSKAPANRVLSMRNMKPAPRVKPAIILNGAGTVSDILPEGVGVGGVGGIYSVRFIVAHWVADTFIFPAESFA